MLTFYNRLWPNYSKKKILTSKCSFFKALLSTAILVAGLKGYGQVDGDFQTKNATGNWSDYLSWNIMNGGSWQAAGPGQLPTATSNVFIQTGSEIDVDVVTATCNDLNFMANGITLKVVLLSNNILTIYGNLVQFDNSNEPFRGFQAGAKIMFAGAADQTITNSGINTNLYDVEINKSGGSFNLPGANTSFNTFVLNSGNVIGGMGAVLTGTPTSSVIVNGGKWTQVLGANRINGGPGVDVALSINAGIMTLATSSEGLNGFNFSGINVINGGSLTLEDFNGHINITNALNIDATSTLNIALPTLVPGSMSFSGTVNYNRLGKQDIMNSSYGNLGLSGSGGKTPAADLAIAGNINISGSAVLPLDNFNALIGGNWTNYSTAGFQESTSIVEFNGSGTQMINTAGGEDFFQLKKSGSGTLMLNSDVRFAGTASELNISDGILDGATNTISGTMSTALVMTGGILKLGKTGTLLPEFSVTTYNLSGASTIELNGNGDQELRGGRDYQNLSFSNGGIKTISTGIPDINGTVFIIGATTVLDITNNTMGGTGTKLTMDDGRFRMSGASLKPDMEDAYTLTGGVIEFYNSGTASNQTINGEYGPAGMGTPIQYHQIEVTGNKVGNSNTNIVLGDGGSFTIKNGGVFEINDDGITGISGTQSVIVGSGGTFKTGDKDGFSGGTGLTATSVNSSIETITLATGSTVEYSRDDNQNITNTLPYSNLVISGNAGVKTAPAGILTVQGDLVKTGSGTFEANGGTVLLNGGTQSFAGLTYNNLQLDNAGTKTLTGNATILDSISIGNLVSDPSTILELNDNDIALKSDAAKTAKVGILAQSSAINYNGSGRFVVERFYNSLRAWRVITLPLTAKGTTGTSIFDTWQNAGIYEPGKGMFVTGPRAANPAPGADGLDWSAQNNYSLKRFSHNAYIGVGNTRDNLVSDNFADTSANIGYFAFVRGDRSRTPNNTIIPNTNTTTLSGRGKLQTGRQTFHVDTDSLNAFTLIGNPYACPVDFNLLTKNNVYPHRFTAYDPTVNGVGVFVVMEDNAIPGVFTPQNVTSTQDNFIQSGQAFFVQPNSTDAPADLVFNEIDKSTNGNNAVLFRPIGNRSQSFATILYKRSDSNNIVLADGVQVQMDDAYSPGIDIGDALKFGNVAENLGIVRDGKILAVERRPVFTEKDTLFYWLTHTAQGKYQFEFKADNIPVVPGLAGYLEDKYTGTATAVKLSGITTVDFSINTEAASSDPYRFRLVFKSSAGPLPFTFINIEAWNQSSGNIVEWAVKNELGISRYELLKSSNGINFNPISAVKATTADSGSSKYQRLDENPVRGNNYYRIRSIAHDGSIAYSSVVNVQTGSAAPGISIYPNPVKNNNIGLQFNDMPSGKYQLRLFNYLGQEVFTSTVNINNGQGVQTKIPATITKGIYQLEVIHPDKTSSMLRVIK